MPTHETGSLLAVLVTQACVQGAVAIVMFGAFIYSIVYLLPKHAAQREAHKRQHPELDMADPCVQTWQMRRYAMLLGALQNIAVALVVAGMCIKIGTVNRAVDGVRVNWTYFALGEAAAFFLLGLSLAPYFRFEKSWAMLVVACLMAAWPVCFGVAPLLHLHNQRLFLFILGIVFQVGAFLYTVWSTRDLLAFYRRLVGILPQLVLLGAYFLYDFFWYVGYLNVHHPGLTLSDRWVSHLPFFIASLLAHVVLPLILMCFFNLDTETHYHAHLLYKLLHHGDAAAHAHHHSGEGHAVALVPVTTAGGEPAAVVVAAETP